MIAETQIRNTECNKHRIAFLDGAVDANEMLSKLLVATNHLELMASCTARFDVCGSEFLHKGNGARSC